MLIYLLTIAFVLCVVHCVCKYNATMRLLRKIPGPKDDFLLGNALLAMTSPVGMFKLMREGTETYKDIHLWWTFFLRVVNIYNPEDIEKVTSTSKHLSKSGLYNIISPWLREGLLLSDGAKWHQRRKILTPAFHFNILRKFFVILEENSQRLIETLMKTNGEDVDIIPVLSEYTLNSICETAMGTRLHDENSTAGKSYKAAVHQLGKLCFERFCSIFLIPEIIFMFSALGRKTKKHLVSLRYFTKKIIQDRKIYIEEHGTTFTEEIEDDKVFVNSKKKKTAMLDLLIAAEKEGIIDGPGIQEEVDTFMFEGHDTTATALNLCLMLLANHKEIQNKIVAELREIFGDSNRPATIEDMSQMRYMECCIKESLRLYPPVPLMGRIISETVQLSGYTVPAGTFCHIHIYDLHRREDLFKNATVFDPDRFLPENSIGRHTHAYIPFSAGPRNCIGQRFAMLEMKSCLAALLRKFKLLPVTRPDDLEFMADFVLRSTKPIYVKFVKINS